MLTERKLTFTDGVLPGVTLLMHMCCSSSAHTLAISLLCFSFNNEKSYTLWMLSAEMAAACFDKKDHFGSFDKEIDKKVSFPLWSEEGGKPCVPFLFLTFFL